MSSGNFCNGCFIRLRLSLAFVLLISQKNVLHGDNELKTFKRVTTYTDFSVKSSFDIIVDLSDEASNAIMP